MEKGKEVLNNLANMARGEAYVWSPEIAFGPKRLTFPMFKTFDSFAPPQLQRKVSESGWSTVDLSAVREKLAMVIEEQKASDPKELKRRVNELEIKLRQVSARSSISTSQPETKEVSVLTDSDKEALQKSVQVCEQLIATVQNVRDEQSREISTLENIIAPLRQLGKRLRPVNQTRAVTPFIAPRQIRSSSAEASCDTSGLSKGAHEVLKAVAQHDAGVTDEQIDVLTGYKKTSRATFKQQLFSRCLIEKGGRGFIATASGIGVLGSDFEHLPTGAQLRDYWMQRLTGGELECFKVYVSAFPSEVENENLMQITGYLKTSVATFRQKLRARNLIVGNKASDDLFESA